jgi:hypothetical protein
MSNRRKLRKPGRYEPQPQSSFAAPALSPSAFLAVNEQAGALLRLRESSTAVDALPEHVTLTETHTKLGEALDTAGSSQLVQLIDAGWGSSGFYKPEILESAAKTRVFAKGTPMFLDHPSRAEEHDRPERSVRDIAAVLAEDARYDPQRKGLVARVQVFPQFRELLSNLAEHIGLSIRADGTSTFGEAEGRSGHIVTAITEALSVDYVTKAGRGGKVLALLESVRAKPLSEARNVGAWLESRLHLELTRIADDMYGDGKLTRDERIALSGAIGDGLQAWTVRVEADAPQLFQRDLWQDPDAPVQVSEAAVIPEPAAPESTAPAAPGNEVSDTTPESETPTKEEPAMSGTETGIPPVQAGTAPVADTAPALSHEARAQIAESQLREAQARITVLESQNAGLSVERDSARGEIRRMRNVESARTAVSAALTAVQDLPAAARTRIAESVVATPPTMESGEVDTAALNAAVTRQVESERAYIASIRESAGEGTPTGLGGGRQQAYDPAAWQASNAAAFARLGLTESAATAAARR